MTKNLRILALLIFLACAALMGFGLYLQHFKNLDPCPLCIFQRVAFITVGAIALAAFLHNPRGVGRVIYGVLIALSATAGVGIAARHAWIQRFPDSAAASCGADLGYMLDRFSLAKVLPMVFKGEGECSSAGWYFLGLTIPEWALVWFVLFVVAGVMMVVARQRRR